MAPNFNPSFIGISKRRTFGTSISGHARHISTAKWSAHIASTIRSFINCWTRAEFQTTSSCSTRNCESGRTITITIGRMGHSTAKPPTSGWSQKREPKRYRSLKTLHLDDVKRRLRPTLVPRVRQARDGSQYGGTQSTDISGINRRYYWSRPCPTAGLTPIDRAEERPHGHVPGRLRGPLLEGRSARRPGRSRRLKTGNGYACACATLI